jgi:hypothetical protein
MLSSPDVIFGLNDIIRVPDGIFFDVNDAT